MIENIIREMSEMSMNSTATDWELVCFTHHRESSYNVFEAPWQPWRGKERSIMIHHILQFDTQHGKHGCARFLIRFAAWFSATGNKEFVRILPIMPLHCRCCFSPSRGIKLINHTDDKGFDPYGPYPFWGRHHCTGRLQSPDPEHILMMWCQSFK